MQKVRTFPQIALLSFAGAAGGLLLKFATRPLFGFPLIKGDETHDTIIWFCVILVILTLNRSAAITANAKEEIANTNDK